MNLILNQRLGRWVCDEDRLVGAMFVNRYDEHDIAILHRSSKTPGKWQVTHFHRKTPWGDSQYSSCKDALGGLMPSGWRLKRVVWRDLT